MPRIKFWLIGTVELGGTDARRQAKKVRNQDVGSGEGAGSAEGEGWAAWVLVT